MDGNVNNLKKRRVLGCTMFGGYRFDIMTKVQSKEVFSDISFLKIGQFDSKTPMA